MSMDKVLHTFSGSICKYCGLNLEADACGCGDPNDWNPDDYEDPRTYPIPWELF